MTRPKTYDATFDRAAIWFPKDSPFLSVLPKDSFRVRVCGRIPGLRRLVRPGHPPVWLLAVLMPSMALLASLFSILSRAGVMNVLLCKGSANCLSSPTDDVATIVHVGYIYEANAALFYLLVAWLWVYCYLRFLKVAKEVIARLESRHYLVTTRRSESVLQCVGRMRRGRWSRWMLIVVILACVYSVVGSEFDPFPNERGPHSGDFWQLAFGYVQAFAMPSYEGKTLGQIKTEYGRAADNIYFLKDLTRQQRDVETVVSVKGSADRPGGPRSERDHAFFWIFLPLAVANESIFVPFAVWTVLQVAFVLWILFRAATKPGYPLQWNLGRIKDPRDTREELELLYGAIQWLIYVAVAAQVASIAANVDKGSGRFFHGVLAHTVPVMIGQNAVTLVALFLALPFTAFLIAFAWLLPDKRRPDDLVQRSKRIYEASKRIGFSNAWLVAPLLVQNAQALGYIHKASGYWRVAADAMDGVVHWVLQWR